MHQIVLRKEGSLAVQLEMMEALNIKSALLQSVPKSVSSLLSNRDLLEIKREHSDRFYISHFLDPRLPFARRKLRSYAEERGVRVIKLLPCAGFQPDSPRWDKFWGAMEELEQVAMIHTGFITARHKEEERRANRFLNSKYGAPIFFDRLARKFPKLQFILCHMGGAMWYEQAAQMVTQHDNVWGDISGFGIFALKRIIQNKVTLDWEKVFWGNDSAPQMYPFNLKLQLDTLEAGGLQDVVPLIFHENGYSFLQRFLK
jgi:predicted TIM-barrel fold metal-dependent hydrolase